MLVVSNSVGIAVFYVALLYRSCS